MRQDVVPQRPTMTVAALDHDWSFVPSSPSLTTRLLRLRAQVARRRPAPPCQILKPLFSQHQWTCVFLYLPDGVLNPSHDYMLRRLRDRPGGLMAICATSDPRGIPAALPDKVDALVWKSLAGFDFSAYAIAIDTIARQSPGAHLLMVNDSVLGPFGDLDAVLAAMPWDLAGFTASACHENHLQSYAFHLRGVDPARADALAPAISTRFAYERYRDVILAQETLFARTAARTMSVGALWHGSCAMGDPSLQTALSLIENGFPFLKRKLFHRNAGLFPSETLSAFLESHGHPIP